MKKALLLFGISIVVALCLMSMYSRPFNLPDSESLSLYDSIVMMDEKWEDAYNKCKLDVMEELISEDLEFYHDQGGLMTSKTKLNDALKDNICGKVKRVLKPGSIEVYEIRGYGAVEMGLHGFMGIDKEGSPEHYAKFVHIWKREHGKWAITRVISLH